MINAQNPTLLLGKMLRIDINVPDSDPRGYRVPADNPFVDGNPIAAAAEIWSFGWRNPWRWSFDDVGVGATGALIVGDVGQVSREEINYEPAGQAGATTAGTCARAPALCRVYPPSASQPTCHSQNPSWTIRVLLGGR